MVLTSAEVLKQGDWVTVAAVSEPGDSKQYILQLDVYGANHRLALRLQDDGTYSIDTWDVR